MLDAFGFWPIGDVVSGIEYRGKNTPDGLEPLIDYFDNTYISGQFRCIQLPTQLDGTVPPIRMHRSHPTFLPELWNIHDITLTNGSRTNNVCEGWNNVFAKFIGHADPTIWRAIDSLRKDWAMASTLSLRDNSGEPPAKRVCRNTVKLQSKLTNLCTACRYGVKSMEGTLKGTGHCIRRK